MPLSDMFSNGLVQPALNWAKQNNLGSALGTMALAIPIAMAAQSMSKRRDRAGAAGGVYRMFGNLAFDQMQRPQRTRDALTLQQIQKGDLSLTPSNAGATPAGDMYGQPYYQAPTLKEQYPDVFAGKTTPGKWQAPLQLGETMPSTTAPPSPAMAILGSQRGQQGVPALISALLKKDAIDATAAREQEGVQQVQDYIQQNPGLSSKVRAGGGKGMSIEAGTAKEGRGVTQAELMQQHLSPAEIRDTFKNKGKGSQKRSIHNIPMTDDRGNEMIVPHFMNPDGTIAPVPKAGMKRSTRPPDTKAAEMRANNQLNVNNSELRMLQQQLAKTGLASKKATIQQRIGELEAENATIIQTFQDMTTRGGVAPAQTLDQHGAQTIQDLYP